MAYHYADFDADVGLTQTVELFSEGSDTVVSTADQVTAQTNRKGTYRARFVDVAAGLYELRSRVSTTPKASWYTRFAGTADEVVTGTLSRENVASISDDKTAADNLEAVLDGTGAVLSLTQLSIVASNANGGIYVTNQGGPAAHFGHKVLGIEVASIDLAKEDQVSLYLNADADLSMAGITGTLENVAKIGGTTQTPGDLAELLNAIGAIVSALPSAATIGAAVWAAGTRTLTGFGTLVADVWSYATRTITGFSSTALNQLTGKVIVLRSPILQGGKWTTVQGDAWLDSIGTALTWENAAGDWPDLTSAVITLEAESGLPANPTADAIGTGSVMVPTGAGQKVKIEVSDDETAALKRGNGRYHVKANWGLTTTKTLVSGDLVVEKRIITPEP